MAVTVVGKDPSAVKRVTCPNCASVLEYTRSDTREVTYTDYGGGRDTYRVLNCPACSKEVTVGR